MSNYLTTTCGGFLNKFIVDPCQISCESIFLVVYHFSEIEKRKSRDVGYIFDLKLNQKKITDPLSQDSTVAKFKINLKVDRWIPKRSFSSLSFPKSSPSLSTFSLRESI